MRRGWRAAMVLCGLCLTLAGGTYGFSVWLRAESRPIVVGLLHSRTGPLAALEKGMLDAELLALEEINAAGGILDRRVRWVVAEGRSDPAVCAEQARRLIEEDKVAVLIGGGDSACRKAVKAVVEESNHLLVYAAAYEGLETSPNVVYAGGPANNRVIPAVSWCHRQLGARAFFSIDSDTLRGRVAGAIVADQVRALGARLVGARHVVAADRDLDAAVAEIVKAAPDAIVSALEGDENRAFLARLARAGVLPGKSPVVSLYLGEEELDAIPPRERAGHYLALNYHQALDRPENLEFVGRFRSAYGRERVVGGAAEVSYTAVRLWAQAVADAETESAAAVRQSFRRQSIDGPEGIVSIDTESLQGWRPFFLGKMRGDGRIEVVFSVLKPIRPIPFPSSRPRADWDAFLDSLRAGWGGHWSNPRREPSSG